MTLLSVYAPTLTSDESSKDRFYDNLRSTLRTVPPEDKVALLGDFNARVGTNHHTVLHQKWKELRSRAQKELRQAENKWLSDKANEIQSYADTNETQKFYDAIKAAYGPRHHSVHPVRTKDGVTLIKDNRGFYLAGLNT